MGLPVPPVDSLYAEIDKIFCWLYPHIHSWNPHNHVVIQPSLNSKDIFFGSWWTSWWNHMTSPFLCCFRVQRFKQQYLVVRTSATGLMDWGEVRGPGSTAAGWLPFRGVGGAGALLENLPTTTGSEWIGSPQTNSPVICVMLEEVPQKYLTLKSGW